MDFIYHADRFFNIKPKTKSGKALAMLNASLYFKKNAASVVSAFKQIHGPVKNSSLIRIEKYTGDNLHVIELTEKLQPLVSHFIKGVYVHGSLGTGEEIAYSDFDALVILADETFANQTTLVLVAQQLYEASNSFFKFDPLQHHRWFIVPEKCLQNYPETFFPVELFKYAKSLFSEGIEVMISPSKIIDYERPFTNLSASIIKNIDAANFPTHMYSLKSLLSEFMLLPAFYVQARDKMGVFKKHSFDLAKKDFTIEDWKIMDEVSYIRNIWHFKITESERSMLSKHDYYSRQKIKKRSVPIPVDILMFLKKDFYNRMKQLALQMQKKMALL